MALETLNQKEETETREYELPKILRDVQEKITERLKLPKDERFSEEELLTILSMDEDRITETKRDFLKNEGREMTDDELEYEKKKYEKIREDEFFGNPENKREPSLAQIELRKILEETGVMQESGEGQSDCSNGMCLLVPGIKGSIRPFESHDGTQLGGDYFFLHHEELDEKSFIDATLMDAEGHGTKCAPLAALSARFIKEAQKQGVPYPQITTELDSFIDSLPIHHNTISFIHATIERNKKLNTKEISVLEAGVGGYVFWIEGNEKDGYRLQVIISESNLPDTETLHSIALSENSATMQAGEGLIGMISGDRLSAEKFQVPSDASIFLSTDGLFDMEDPEDERHFVEELNDFSEKFFSENRNTSRQEIEERFYNELMKRTENFKQTDDVTWFRVTI